MTRDCLDCFADCEKAGTDGRPREADCFEGEDGLILVQEDALTKTLDRLIAQVVGMREDIAELIAMFAPEQPPTDMP
jgi:hypothetical protein